MLRTRCHSYGVTTLPTSPTTYLILAPNYSPRHSNHRYNQPSIFQRYSSILASSNATSPTNNQTTTTKISVQNYNSSPIWTQITKSIDNIPNKIPFALISNRSNNNDNNDDNNNSNNVASWSGSLNMQDSNLENIAQFLSQTRNASFDVTMNNDGTLGIGGLTSDIESWMDDNINENYSENSDSSNSGDSSSRVGVQVGTFIQHVSEHMKKSLKNGIQKGTVSLHNLCLVRFTFTLYLVL